MPHLLINPLGFFELLVSFEVLFSSPRLYPAMFFNELFSERMIIQTEVGGKYRLKIDATSVFPKIASSKNK